MRYYYYCCTVLLSITPSKMISIPPSISVGKETYDIKCLIFKINVSYIWYYSILNLSSHSLVEWIIHSSITKYNRAPVTASTKECNGEIINQSCFFGRLKLSRGERLPSRRCLHWCFRYCHNCRGILPLRVRSARLPCVLLRQRLSTSSGLHRQEHMDWPSHLFVVPWLAVPALFGQWFWVSFVGWFFVSLAVFWADN